MIRTYHYRCLPDRPGLRLCSRRRGSAGTHGMGEPDRDIAQAKGFIAPPGYSWHRPETTLLYQLVAEHYPRFRDRRASETLNPPHLLRHTYLLASENPWR